MNLRREGQQFVEDFPRRAPRFINVNIRQDIKKQARQQIGRQDIAQPAHIKMLKIKIPIIFHRHNIAGDSDE